MLGTDAGLLTRVQDIAVGRLPVALASGDFGGDDHEDLVVVQNFFGSLSLLLGDGRGHFVREEMGISVDEGPESIAVGDFNGDGVADLAVANRGADSVSVLLRDNLGGWIQSELAVPEPTSVVATHVNDDGELDLAVTSFANDSVRLLRGDGSGRFPTQLEIPVGRGPRSLIVADLNADSLPDLAVVNQPSGTVTIVLAGMEGNYLAQPELKVGNEPVFISAADLDADGHPDLAIANSGGDAASLLFNQLLERADTNGSNRIDGFDLIAVGRAGGCAPPGDCYRRAADVDLNGLVDGNDFIWVASDFGRSVAQNQLQANLDPASPPPAPDTVSFQQVAHDGDLLRVAVVVHHDATGVAGARFGVEFDAEVLEFVRSSTGGYLAGEGTRLFLSVTDQTLDETGRLEVTLTRLTNQDAPVQDRRPIVNLFFRAQASGESVLEFAPATNGEEPALVDAAAIAVEGPSFVGGGDRAGNRPAAGVDRLRRGGPAGHGHPTIRPLERRTHCP